VVFSQARNAVTFALVVLGLAVLVADPGQTDELAQASTQLPEALPVPVADPVTNPDSELADAPDPDPIDPEWDAAPDDLADQQMDPSQGPDPVDEPDDGGDEEYVT